MKVINIIYITSFLACFNLYAEKPLSKNYYNISPYWVINDDLYTNKLGELFFQTVKLNDGHLELIYLKRFLFDDGSTKLNKKLEEVIDKDSWSKINGYLYRDKNNLYCFQSQTMGGFLVQMVNFNPDNLLFTKGATWVSLEKLNELQDETFSLYISNGKQIYYVCEKLENADLSSFHIIEGYLSSAEDKYYNYFGSTAEKK